MSIKVLSLFDGMGCGYITLRELGVPVDRYVAYEIDKYAIQTALHNFPDIEQRGDVKTADFTEFDGFDWVLAGFPCTKFSIAQKKDRETKPYSGEGWELFEEAWRAVQEAKPKYFLFENNKSMAKAVQQEISKIIGFEPVLINSALVSAQNRQRIYWLGVRNADGTYSKVAVEQPADRGILLKDVLDDSCLVERDKAYCLKHQAGNARDYFKKHHTNVKFEPVNPLFSGKARCITSGYANKGAGHIFDSNYSDNPHKQQWDSVAEPVYVGELPEHNGKYRNGNQPSQQCRVYAYYGKSVCVDTDPRRYYAIPVESETVLKAIPEIQKKYGYVPEKFNAYNRAEITDKSPTLSTGSMVTSSCAVNKFQNITNYATPCEWDENGAPTKAISAADGKVYPVYEVKNGLITVKGKQYPIKLKDGYYIIRKLTVTECMRLQTIPDWYEFPVSDSQAYKMLGNGWTVDVIAHIFTHITK